MGGPRGEVAPDQLSEDDLALLHALQLWPRASWTALAPILSSSPSVLAARWNRLRSNNLAWVYAYPLGGVARGSRQVAVVEVDCASGVAVEVARELETRPYVRGLDFAASGRHLMLVVTAKSFTRMSSHIVDELARIPGVASTRSHLSAHMHVEGRQWRLDALDPRQQAAVEAAAHCAAPDIRDSAFIDLGSEAYAPLLSVLGIDGRATATDIAERIGRPASTVRRQLGLLLRAGALAMRCEMSQQHTRWPVSVTWWLRAPHAVTATVVARLRAERRIRMCMSVAGTANLVVTAWTADLADLMRLQAAVESMLPSNGIVDTSVSLRTRKRSGWLLAPDGRLDRSHSSPVCGRMSESTG
ncbi:helix-turn-helix domain-containing protein [Kutzneria sp. CA-103260]|uniref:helix-turn-helix domain-containing protein n=1 Tax=Kutzneria sp. CA-103260 TaxID=2802641 RepID=UPI001BACE25E|nr:Lrp/AsnC family transcriptional regulator [Kutzneria sp. CA-103260]QUQ68851.1 AsnC family transcriptional regulator [Kutzneria sp. CA-103260]